MKSKQDQFLQRIYIALTNVLNTPELLAALARFTYDEPKIREALSLYNTVEALGIQREQAQEAQYQATLLLKQSKAALLKIFKVHLDTARLAYKRESATYQDTLHLTRTVPRATTECLRHIKRFYAHIPVPMLLKYDLTKKELNDAVSLLERVQELVALQSKTRSQPQQLTEMRNQALVELDNWMRRFDKVAQIALDDMPQQGEALGQVVKG